MSELFDEGEVRKALATMLEPGAVFEVRALDAHLRGNRRTGTVSGYFDNADACLKELEKLDSAMGVYITLNPVNPALLSRRANRLAYAEKNATTNDQHILILTGQAPSLRTLPKYQYHSNGGTAQTRRP